MALDLLNKRMSQEDIGAEAVGCYSNGVGWPVMTNLDPQKWNFQNEKNREVTDPKGFPATLRWVVFKPYKVA